EGTRPRPVPAADAHLNQVRRVAVPQPDIVHVAVVAVRGRGRLVRRPVPGRGVHPLIHVLLLDVEVPVDVDDADIAVDVGRHAAHNGNPRGMVAPAYDREGARRVDVRDGLGHLVEGLLDVAGDDEDVPGVAQIELLVDVDRAVDRVAVVERGDAAHALGSEAGARAIGRGRGEGGADGGVT